MGVDSGFPHLREPARLVATNEQTEGSRAMKSRSKWLVVLIPALAVLTALTGMARVDTRPVERDALQHGLDELVAAGAAGALIEVRDERGTWRGTSGVAELGTSRPVPAGGHFRAGSVTKTFVATVALQLVAEGRLRLDDTVERWLPGEVPGGEGITVRQLLSHTSGLYDYGRALPLLDQAGFQSIRWRTWDPRELVKLATDQPPLFEPGASWSYSSTNYILLGLIVEQVTGHPYDVEVERRIIGPLGLHHTWLPGTSTRLPDPHAHGYLPDLSGGQAPPLDVTELNPSSGWAAGEVISTAADLDRFFAALLSGRMLPPAQLQEMTTLAPHARDYGLGLRQRTLPCGTTVYGHDGDAPGFSTWSFTTADTRRQATVSATWGTTRPDNPDTLLSNALCPTTRG